MKKWIQQPAMVLVLGGLCLAACSKSGSDEKSKTNTEKISASAWKYDKAEVDLNKDGTADSPIPNGYLSTCETDNLITFKADGTGTIDEGPTKCDVTDQQSVGFTWTFKNNETILNFPTAIITGVDGDVIIKSITETSMVLQKEVTLTTPLPINANVILTLKH